jgi:hypothetical protein
MGVRSQFLPHNSATLQFKVLVDMQMDAYLKKEQTGTLFVWVGAPEGFFLGGGVRGVKPKNQTKKSFLAPPAGTIIIM